MEAVKAKKRAHKSLTIEEKVEILDQSERKASSYCLIRELEFPLS